jgi:ribose transport system substrate-binding protein
MKRAALTVLCLIIALLVLTSCSKKSANLAKQPEMKYTVGVTLLRKADPFYHQLEAAMREEAAKNNIRLLVQSGEMDLPTQTHQVENFITQKVDAIVVCPVDSESIAGAIKKANRANVPVFTADIAAHGGDVVCHIASDNVAGGRVAGEYMVKLLNGKGKVVIVNHPLVASVQERVKGFKEAISESEIEIVDDQPCEGLRDKAMTVMENLLQKHKKLDGVFAINDSTALGCLAAIRAAGRKDIVIVGYDGDPEARKEIMAGSPLKADAVQYPREIGKETIRAILRYFDGEELPKVLPVKVGAIDQASLMAEQAQKQ